VISTVQQGSLTSINRNYAFIQTGDRRLFFHRGEWKSEVDFAGLPEGTTVVFEEGQNSQGPCAVNVRLAGEANAVVTQDEGYRTGEVRNLQLTFGFIRTLDGESLFFHRNNLRNQADFERLRLGDEVGFRLGRNHLGKCADDVDLNPETNRPGAQPAAG
jgi:cold shock CspA family protein